MAQQLMAVLPEDPSSVSSNQWQLTTVCNSSFRGSDTLIGIHAGKRPMSIK